MSDFKEGLPVDIEERDPWRPAKVEILTDKIMTLSWGKSIKDRIVNFKQDDGKYAWGLEYSIPLRYKDIEEEFRKNIKKVDKKNTLTEEDIELFFQEEGERRLYSEDQYLKIPMNITKIRVLDLSPQEGMPRSLKSIRLAGIKGKIRELFPQKSIGSRIRRESVTGEPNATKLPLIQAALNNSIRRKTLSELISNVLGGNDKEKKLLESVLRDSKASEMLIIAAHGGSDNDIGEQTGAVVGKYADGRQARGNWVDLAQVVEKYDKPEAFAAILIRTCYYGTDKPPVKSIPVFRPKGSVPGGIVQNRVYVSMPEGNGE